MSSIKVFAKLSFYCALCLSWLGSTKVNSTMEQSFSSSALQEITLQHHLSQNSRPNGLSTHPSSVLVFSQSTLDNLYATAVDKFLIAVRKNPQAVVLLPTGATPRPFYTLLIERFRKNQQLDLSQVKFFNLDEYVGLEEDHPLSYTYYMQKNLFDPLREIDARRAPQAQHCHIPTCPNRKDSAAAAAAYRAKLQEAIASNPSKKIDFALLGVGGAYTDGETPEGDPILKGGHIAFNEPSTPLSSDTHVATLTPKTRRDTAFRFKSLKKLYAIGDVQTRNPPRTSVPYEAITIGPSEIMSAHEVVVLATGQSKALVLKHVLEAAPSSNFPASFLQHHPNVTWLIDEEAAMMMASYKPSRNFSVQNIEKSLSQNKLPQGKTVLILSPHPDDDVIHMAGAMEKLQNQQNNVYVAYVTTGSNAVRTSEPAFDTLYTDLKARGIKGVEAIENAKRLVREQEARDAVSYFGIPENNLVFLKASYYNRRGIPGVDPLTPKDVQQAEQLLRQLKPDIIFFAAENDPHGAHGLSTELFARAYKNIQEQTKGKKLPTTTFWGYRGAYTEWGLDQEAEKLVFVLFDDALAQKKITSIKAHASQLDPLFPYSDPRPFYQQADDRNQETAQQLAQIMGAHVVDATQTRAEVFRVFSPSEFLETYYKAG